MKRIFLISNFLVMVIFSFGQNCNNMQLTHSPSSEYGGFFFDLNYSCCYANGVFGAQNRFIDYGDGTTSQTPGNYLGFHLYQTPGTYIVYAQFFCSIDSTFYGPFYDTITLGCPNYNFAINFENWYDYANTQDSFAVGILYTDYQGVNITIDSIDWGDGTFSEIPPTPGQFTMFHKYGPYLDTSYSVNIPFFYALDSSCTYNTSIVFDFPCGQVNPYIGVWAYWYDINRARFNCNNANFYQEWYITEFGDSIYGNGTHLVYFPDTGYVHYCKFRQNTIDTSCFSFACDSVYINDTIWGCMDPLADNYDPFANTGDTSCLYFGCTDPTAFNYDPTANASDSSCVYAHNVVLSQGWSLVSSYRQPVNSSIVEMFSHTNGYHELVVKNGLGQVYYPGYGVNQIDSVRPGEGFQVRVALWFSNPVVGEMIIPEQTPIALPQGWSIVGYPRTSNGPIATMLIDILPNMIIMKDDDGGVYWTQFGVNQIGDMQPGEGYQIKMSQSDTLYYPANGY